MKYNIRPYLKQDKEEVIELWFRSTVTGQSFLPKEFWESVKPLLREKYIPIAETWIAEQDGKILGFISLLDHLIGGLFVDLSSQGKGIGGALIRHAQEIRTQPLSVEVFEKNERARRFYKKCGFTFKAQTLQEESGEMVFVLHQPSSG